MEDLRIRRNQQALPNHRTLLRIERILNDNHGGDTIIKRWQSRSRCQRMVALAFRSPIHVIVIIIAVKLLCRVYREPVFFKW
jgi:hypothetical protein